MSRWCTLTSLIVLAVFVPTVGHAQPGPGSVMPAGWQAPPPGYYPPANYAPGQLPPGPRPTIYEELPDDTGWLYDDPPIDRWLKNSLRHAYFRVDYLNWSISDPGKNVLGSETSVVPSPTVFSQPIIVNGQTITLAPNNALPVNIQTPVFPTEVTVVAPTLEGVHTNSNNGIRTTVGLPTFNAGTLEASWFGLQTSNAQARIPSFPAFDLNDRDGDGNVTESIDLVQFVGQPILTNGAVTQNTTYLVYDQSYDSLLKTSVWGTDAQFLFDPYDAGAPLVFRPLVGLRYFSFWEELNQSGSYTYVDSNDPTQRPILNRQINSKAVNNLYGPEFGFRAELNNKFFTIGAQPRVMLGANSYKTELFTSQVLSDVEPNRLIQRNDTTFGLLGDLEVFSRLNVNDHLSLYVSYNLMWAGLITRPADNIIYNGIPSTPAISDFGLDVDFSGALIQGLSIGGQLTY